MDGKWIGGAVFMLECENFSEHPIKLSERVEDYNLAQNPCAIYLIINFGKFTSSNDILMYIKLVEARH